VTARTDRTSSDDSTLFFSPKSPKKTLQIRRPDTVTPIPPLLQADLNDADIARQLRASPHSQKKWPAFGMSKADFISRAHELHLSPEEARALAADVQSFVQNLLDRPETDHERHAEQVLRNAEKLPISASCGKIIATNALAGTAGFLTSFLLGKCAANLLALGVGAQGAWIFPIAGLLNVLLSEPVVGAIRMQGAFHPSNDGTAYTDYNTACARLQKAQTLDDKRGMQHWTREIAKIVDEIIAREEAKPRMWFRSKVEKPPRDADGFALNQDGKHDADFAKKTEKVIVGARKRSFVTDELPFNFYTVNYFLSGALAPYFRALFSAGDASGIDLALSAGLGMLSGAQTAIAQDYLRKAIQQVPLRGLADNIKHAKAAVVGARHYAWVDPMVRATACVNVLQERLTSLEAAADDGHIVRKGTIEKARADLATAKDVRRTIVREHRLAKRHHEAHSAGRHRFLTQAGELINAYLGEKSDPPRPMQGRRAMNRVIAKTIATPLALTLTPLYTSVIVPAILAAMSAANAIAAMSSNSTGTNFTEPTNMTNFETNSTAMSDPAGPDFTLIAAKMGLSAMFSIPLIVGYMSRNLVVAPIIERRITDLETQYAVAMPDDDSDSELVLSGGYDSDSGEVLNSSVVSAVDESDSSNGDNSGVDSRADDGDPSGVLESVVVTHADGSSSRDGQGSDSEV